jgi:hypothetical protein
VANITPAAHLIDAVSGNLSGEYSIVNTSEGDEFKVWRERSHFLTLDIGNSQVKSFANLWYSDKVKDYYVELLIRA